MNLKERITNWLTGGRFVRLANQVGDHGNLILRNIALEATERHLGIAERALIRKDEEIRSLETGLREIIAMQTPSANATVRRIVSVAKRTLDPLKSEAAAVLRVKNGLSSLDDGCGYGCEIIPTTCCGPTCKHNPCSCDDGPDVGGNGKRKRNKPFAIEWRMPNSSIAAWREWTVWKRYERESDMETALKALQSDRAYAEYRVAG